MADLDINVRADTASANRGINNLSSNLRGIGGVARGVTGAIAGMMAPLIGIVAVFGGIAVATKGIKETLDFGGELDDMSSKTGIAIKDLVILKEAFKFAGMEGADLGKIVNGLSAKLDAPTPKILETMKLLGLSMEKIQALPIGERFQVVGDAISNLSSATARASASQTLFGKTMGNNLLVLFNNKGAMEEAKKSVGGLAQSMDTYGSRFAGIGDKLDSIGTKIMQFFAQVLGQNIARLQNAADWLLNLDLTNAGKELGKVLNTLGDIVETMMEAKSIGELFENVSGAIEMGWLKAKPMLIDGLKEVAAIFGNALIESIKQTSVLFKGLSDSAEKADILANAASYMMFGTSSKNGQIQTSKTERSPEEQKRLNFLESKFLGDKPSEYNEPDVAGVITRAHKAIAAYYDKLAKVAEDGIRSKFNKAQDLIGNFKAKSKEDTAPRFKGLMDRLFSNETLKNPLTRLQSVGGAAISTKNSGMNEQRETNNILRQIKDILSKNPPNTITTTTKAVFGS